MADPKKKYEAGYATTVLQFNVAQMAKQMTQDPGRKASVFLNSDSLDVTSYGIETTDLLFAFHRPYIGRAGNYPTELPTNPDVHASLTGLRALPGAMNTGIAEIVEQTGISEAMMHMCILACMDVIGVAVFDKGVEKASAQAAADLTVQVSGVVTAQAYEKMHVGGLVKVALPPSTKFASAEWWRGPGKAPGKITPVLTMATPRDVTSYSATLMQEYIYNNGRRALSLLRKDANLNMFSNYAVSQKEYAVTCGILFQYAMAERGFVPTPFSARINAHDLAWYQARRPGADIGVASDIDGRAIFGANHEGNHGYIFFERDPARAAEGGFRQAPAFNMPAEIAVFHGSMTGLLRAQPTSLAPPVADRRRYVRALEHIDHVSTSPDYADARIAYAEALDRFFKLTFPQSSAGGTQVLHEFGLSPFGEGRRHVARVATTPETISNATDDLYGRMLLQSKQAFQFSVGSTENLYMFLQKLIIGTCVAGCTPKPNCESTFQYYLNL